MIEEPKVQMEYFHNLLILDEDYEKIFGAINKIPGFSIKEDRTIKKNTMVLKIKKFEINGKDEKELIVKMYKEHCFMKFTKMDETGLEIKYKGLMNYFDCKIPPDYFFTLEIVVE